MSKVLRWYSKPFWGGNKRNQIVNRIPIKLGRVPFEILHIFKSKRFSNQTNSANDTTAHFSNHLLLDKQKQHALCSRGCCIHRSSSNPQTCGGMILRRKKEERREKRQKAAHVSITRRCIEGVSRVCAVLKEEERVRVSERRHLPQERDDIEGTGEGEREFDFELHWPV